jgi:AsmA protein
MGRLLKIVLALLAALLVLMLGAAAVALLLVDPNEYRDEIETLALAQTGRTLTIDGELGLRVLPCCSVAIDDMRLGNPVEFDDPDFASVRSIRLGLRLLPLLFQQRVVVDEVVLDGLTVNLLRRADGVSNWEFETAAAPDAPPVDADASTTSLPELSVAGIRIDEASLVFRDDTAGTHVAVDELSVSTGPVAMGEPVTFDATLRVRDLVSQASVSAALKALFLLDGNVVSLSKFASTTTVSAPDLPGGSARITLSDGAIRADLESGRISLDGIATQIAAAGVELGIGVSGSIEGDAMALSGTLGIAPFSPRKVLATLGEPPIETTDPSVLSSAEAQADWSLTAERIDVSALHVKLDDSTITGGLGVRYGGPVAMNFTVEIDAIDVDRYLPPATEEAATGEATTAEPEPLPVETLRDLDLEGRAAIGRLVAGGLTLQNTLAVVRARDGLIRIDPSSADVYDGRYKGQLSLDVKTDVPKLSFTQSLESVQAGGILADLYAAENLQGRLQARIEGNGRGSTADELLGGLRGSVEFDLEDAVYTGADIWYEIRRAVALAKGKAGPAVPAEPQTEITALGFAGTLEDGVLRSNRLIAEIPFIRIGGGGTFDLVQNRIDYDLQARILSRPDFPDADDLADLERITIPIEVTGDAANPRINIDLAELAKNAAVEKGKERLLKKLGLDEPDEAADNTSDATAEPDARDEARKLLKKGLSDLFKR